MACPFRNFNNYNAFQTTPIELFRALLLQYADYCQGRAVQVNELSNDSKSVKTLHEFFSEHDPDMPRELLSSLHLVDELSTSRGFDALVDAAEQMKQVIFSADEGIGHRGLALRTFLYHREVFDLAHQLHAIESVEKMLEFAGKADRVLRSVPSKEQLERMENGLKPFFVSRGRGPLCEITASKDGHELNFLVAHGGQFRVDGTVDNNNKQNSISYRPSRHDLIKYDSRRHRLKIRASDRPSTEAYRRTFGEVLFGDREYFGGNKLVSLRPLVELGRASLEPTRGLSRITLISLKIAHRNQRETVISVDSDDVFSDVELANDLELETGELLYARFAVQFESNRRKRRLEIRPPNSVEFNRSYEPGVIEHFLESRRFDLGTKPEMELPLRGFFADVEKYFQVKRPITEWRERLGASMVDALEGSGLLTASDMKATDRYRCGGAYQEGCPRKIEAQGNGAVVAVCGLGQQCADISIPVEQARWLSVQRDRFLAALAYLLGTQPQLALGDRAAYMHLGDRHFGSIPVRFYFAPRPKLELLASFFDVATRSRSVANVVPALVVPQRGSMSDELINKISENGVKLLFLSECVSVVDIKLELSLARFILDNKLPVECPGKALWPNYWLVVDEASGRYWLGGNKVDLTPNSKPARMLEVLARNAATLVTRRDLVESVWPLDVPAKGKMLGKDVGDFDNRIAVAMVAIRNALGVAAGAVVPVIENSENLIETINGDDIEDRGYILHVPAHRVALWKSRPNAPVR